MQNRTFLQAAALGAVLALAGCATTGGAPVDVTGADVSSRTMDNGDVIEEYRVGQQLRMVRITPARGAAYYLYDRDGDGSIDRDRDDVPATYWQLFKW